MKYGCVMKHEVSEEIDKLTYDIIGCAMRVHTALGNGFQEVIYQRCLELEFENNTIPYIREFEIPVFYLDKQVGKRRVDFLVDNKVMVELKAIINLEDVHLAQAINYLEAYKLNVGLLINFGSQKLQYKRVLKKHNE